MIQELLDIRPTESFDAICRRMSSFLGLEEPIPENAMRRAIQDEDFANNLITCRNAPDFLRTLLDDPGNARYENRLTNADLLKKAAEAFLRWGKAGFSVVGDDVLEKRENACLSCEHLSKPEKMLQKLVTSGPGERIGKRAADCVCRLCGCSISKKIRLPSESCPALHPGDSRLNRWGEPADAGS